MFKRRRRGLRGGDGGRWKGGRANIDGYATKRNEHSKKLRDRVSLVSPSPGRRLSLFRAASFLIGSEGKVCRFVKNLVRSAPRLFRPDRRSILFSTRLGTNGARFHAESRLRKHVFCLSANSLDRSLRDKGNRQDGR